MKQTHQLDEIDRRILRIIQREGDISTAALGERVGTSSASCWRRLKALANADILGPVVRLLRPEAVGRGLDAICQIRMKSHDIKAREEFESLIAAQEEILECFSTSGEWDYQIHVVVPDVAAYEQFLMRKLLNHPAVAASASHFVLKRIKYSTALPI